MMFAPKIWLIIGYTVFVFGLSWHIHNKFEDAAKVKTVTKELGKSHKAQNDIVKFNQDLRKAKTDACFNAPMPADVVRLLQQ